MAAGLDVARFNMSHGSHDTHLAAYQAVLLTSQPRAGIEGPWSTLWRTQFADVIKNVMQGKLTAKDGIDQGVTIWSTMRDDFRRTHSS